MTQTEQIKNYLKNKGERATTTAKELSQALNMKETSIRGLLNASVKRGGPFIRVAKAKYALRE